MYSAALTALTFLFLTAPPVVPAIPKTDPTIPSSAIDFQSLDKSNSLLKPTPV